MSVIDWTVVIVSCLLVFAAGFAYARRSSDKGAEGYFAGDRDVPWWAIGLSNTATYSSGTGAFVMLVLVFGLAGNWLWWASRIIWMPLVAIIWARLWRRMQIVTTAELISLRYGGAPASFARKVYAFVCCFVFAVLIISYITGFFTKTLQPIVPFKTWEFDSALGIGNDPAHIDQGWTVELAFPWAGMRSLFARPTLPPKEGDTLRASFSRFEALRYHGKTVAESPGWALNAHGVYDSHIPECFSYLHFSEKHSPE